MLSHLFSIACITLIISVYSFTYGMTMLKRTWQNKPTTTTRTSQPVNVRQYTVPRPPVTDSSRAVNSPGMRERFNAFSTKVFDRIKNFFWQSKMHARILTHGITENDVIYKIKNSPETSIDIFLNYLKDIDQEKANAFLDKLMLSNPRDSEIGFLFSAISNQVWNKKRNYNALEKLSSWTSLKLMELLKLPNTEEIITDMIIYLIGLDQKQKIGRQILLNLSSICQTTTGRYLIKEISILGTILQGKKLEKFQQEVGRTIYIIWSNIVNALKNNKETLSLLEGVLKNETAEKLLKIATVGEILKVATAIKILQAEDSIDLSEIIAAKNTLETAAAKKLLETATTEQILDFAAVKQILVEIKKYDAIQEEKRIAEMSRTIIE